MQVVVINVNVGGANVGGARASRRSPDPTAQAVQEALLKQSADFEAQLDEALGRHSAPTILSPIHQVAEVIGDLDRRLEEALGELAELAEMREILEGLKTGSAWALERVEAIKAAGQK